MDCSTYLRKLTGMRDKGVGQNYLVNMTSILVT
jgi:hypothetical protein